MEKKKNNKLLLPLIICIPLFIVCLIMLLTPQKVSDYLFYNVDYTRHTGFNRYGFDGSFYIDNNSDTDLTDVTINIEYVVQHGLEELEYGISLTTDLNIDDNRITFVHEESGFGVYTLLEIEKITISIDGTTYEVQDKDSAGRPNWLIVGGAAIGFIGSAASFVLWLSSNKKFENPMEQGLRNFEERIKEAFKPAEPVEKKSERITCHYCKCKYDADKHSKCPNCGAPPEPKD